MGYVIGSGWWCDDSRKHAGSVNNNSTDATRDQNFFNIWYQLIEKYTKPEKILVTDSASPIVPSGLTDGKNAIEFIRLKRNFMHAAVCDTQFCGWTRAFMSGAFYAFINDCDYVYIEQDVLIHGDGIVETALENMADADFSHGLWEHNYKTEQSFVVIKRDAIVRFIGSYMNSFGESDRQMRPELKFLKMGDQYLSAHGGMRFKELPFGYGRKRPIDFGGDLFYAQHWTDNELRTMLELEGISFSDHFGHDKEKY